MSKRTNSCTPCAAMCFPMRRAWGGGCSVASAAVGAKFCFSLFLDLCRRAWKPSSAVATRDGVVCAVVSHTCARVCSDACTDARFAVAFQLDRHAVPLGRLDTRLEGKCHLSAPRQRLRVCSGRWGCLLHWLWSWTVSSRHRYVHSIWSHAHVCISYTKRWLTDA